MSEYRLPDPEERAALVEQVAQLAAPIFTRQRWTYQALGVPSKDELRASVDRLLGYIYADLESTRVEGGRFVVERLPFDDDVDGELHGVRIFLELGAWDDYGTQPGDLADEA